MLRANRERKDDMKDILVGVIAGTPTDTAFGAELLTRHGIRNRSFAVSATPAKQTALQAQHPALLADIVQTKVKEWEMRRCHAHAHLL